MSWFKSILLLSVLGMTWVECDRHPAAHTWSVPDALLDTAPTNNMVMPAGARRRVLSQTGESSGSRSSMRLARTDGLGH